MEVYIEQLVPKKKAGTHFLLVALLLTGAALLEALLFYTFLYFAYIEYWFAFTPIIVYVTIFLIRRMNIEYEYIVTNGELDIDQITSQRKRRRLLSVSCKSFEAFGKYKPEAFEHRNFKTRQFFGSSKEGEGLWYADFHHPQTGHTLLVIEPDERTLGAIKPYLSRQVARSLVIG